MAERSLESLKIVAEVLRYAVKGVAALVNGQEATLDGATLSAKRDPLVQRKVSNCNSALTVDSHPALSYKSLIGTGRRDFECKIYLNPDLRLLNQTNISAHDTFAQTRFYASVMVLKLGTEFGLDFETYKNPEDGAPKSEAGFMAHLNREPAQSLTRGERNTRFRSYLQHSILDHTENQATRLVSKGNRSTDETPLTIDMLSKSLFASFLYTEPTEDNMATDAYKRDKEIENNVALMNMLYDVALANWNTQAGENNGTQRRLSRLFRSKSIMAWSDLIKGAVSGKLDLDDPDDQVRPFYRDFSETNLSSIRKVVEKLVNWSRWSAPPNDDIDRVLSDNKAEVKKWLKANGLTTSYLMGAPE